MITNNSPKFSKQKHIVHFSARIKLFTKFSSNPETTLFFSNLEKDLFLQDSKMGNSCSPSNLDSYASNLFDVYNVDARLFKHSKGRIQITNNGLLLHYENSHGQQGPILWPLNGIRRYGFHKNIFLFECGRKCASGEGLFAFKCSKAKRLNDAIHKAIVNSATQVYNLQENLSVTKKYAKTNNVADLNSTVVTNLLSSNDADSLNYTSLNESNQATSNSKKYLVQIFSE